MNQLPDYNSKEQQPDVNSSVEHQADNFQVDGDISTVQGDSNRVIHRASNRNIQGDRNSVIQGDRNQAIQGNNSQINNVWNFFNQQEAVVGTPLTRQEYRNRQALLNKVNNFWVKGVLEKSLYNQVMIELGLEERPDAITNPWNVIIETDDSSPQPLPDGTKIIDIFDQIGTGRTLLILGEPGSGKTTTLLELTRDLIARAEQDINRLIPVVFNLSSWANKRQKIEDWLVEELNSKYSVPKKIGQAWITQQQLLPLLDGLDEVKVEYRDNCIAALNQFKQDYGAELVVCSRIKDYEALSNRLNFQSAVYIRLLTLEQICDYLNSVGAELVGLRALIKEDTVLQELAKSPLMLNIMTLAYQGVAVEDLPKTEVLEERRRQLFGDYIEKMFKRRKNNWQYSKGQAMRWLVWLAQNMSKNSQTIFLLERIQSTLLLNKSQKFIYATLHGLSLGQVMGFILIVSGSDLFNGIMAGTILSILIGFTWGIYVQEIQTIEALSWSWIKFKDNLFNVFLGGVFVWLIGGYVLGLIKGLIFVLILMIIAIIVLSLREERILNTRYVNQGIFQSAKNGIIFSLIGVLGMGIFGLFIGIPIFKAAVLGIIWGLCQGFPGCIQHFSLRLILYFNNYIPWNYARFLDYATERIFLQKVGGGYIFIHRMLMEHFAQMELER